MRIVKLLMFVLLAATLAWSEASAEELTGVSSDGWHSWYVDAADGQPTEFYVRVEDGKPVRIHSLNWNCRKPTRESIVDHGRVSAVESFAWFRAVVEDAAVDKHIRDAALFGLVESGPDDALEYIDRILSEH